MKPLFLALALSGLPAGSPIPDLSAPNQDGKLVRLSDFKGKRVLVYFYPKDDTPGCTREAKSLRDDYARFQQLGVVILGVSRQDAKSHQAFRAKHELPFDLLTDTDGNFARAMGVDRIPVLGWHKRQSVLIDRDGTVIRFFDAVDPAKHSAEVISVLEALK